MKKTTNRPLGTNEKVYWVLDQKNTTQFAVAAEIDGNATDSEWRQALDTVQNRHPNLSVHISGNEYSTAQFIPVEDCRIPLRIVNAASGEGWNNILEEELSNPLDLNFAPLTRATLIQQPGKSIFIFLSNHCIGDGMSVALLIRDVLTVLSGKTVEDLLESDQPGFEQAKISLVPRTTINVERLSLSGTLTRKLIDRSKSERTTVHGALSAAIVLALKSRSGASLKENPVRILHPLSARTTLGLGEDFSLLLSIITLPHEPAPQQTFWDFAREVRQGIAFTQTQEWLKADTNATQGLFNSGLDLNTVEGALHQGTAHEIMLTNLGLLSFPSEFGPLQLKSLWGPVVLTPHPLAQTIGVATFNGELTLSLTSLAPSKSLLEAVEKLIEKVCSTQQDMQIDEFYYHPVMNNIRL
jgi:hypothetical protein